MRKEQFVYVTYIAAAPERVWDALTVPEITRQYWGNENISDWLPGSSWEHRRPDESHRVDLCGRVLESERPRRLSLTWALPADARDQGKHSRVSFDIEPAAGVSKLTVRHDELESGSEMLAAITNGWPVVISSLKSFIETGSALPQALYG